MNGKLVLGVIAIVAVMAVCAAIFREFWFMLIGGGPLFVGIVVIAVFLLGVFIGSTMRS